MNFRLPFLRIVIVALHCLFLSPTHASTPKTVQLAGAGKALQQVVVSESASEATRAAAKELADYLGRIAGTTFEVRVGDGLTGIAVGRYSDFSRLDLAKESDSRDATRREDYRLWSHANGLYVIGATDQAVSHAVWDLLYRLGYRQYFPGDKWEIVPNKPELSISVDANEHPSYQARQIWYGYRGWNFSVRALADWSRKNRLGSGLKLRLGHAYHDIYKRNKNVFDQHQEYLCNDKSMEVKFRISNPELRQLVIADALQQIADHPEFDNVSMEPSDGGGWCESEDSDQLGSVPDRALFLSNEVATAINKKYPGKLVSMYAYNYHSPPPSIQAHPQVLVMVATAFLRGGYTLDELIEGWSARTSRLGIREYYSVNPWDHDMPGKARAGNIDYLKRTIPEYHAKGARVLSAESSDNWGPNGLGYYLAARMLWDVREARNTDALIEDFLANAFGPAREPMREFYRQLDGSQPHPVISDQLGRMFRALEQARRLANTPEINARLDDLTLYARYADLYQRYLGARSKKQQEAVEALFRYAYRIRKTIMVHTKALHRVIAKHYRPVTIPPPSAWNNLESKHSRESAKPSSPAELADFVREGIVRYPLSSIDFQPVKFSRDLTGIAPLNLAEMPVGNFGASGGKQVFYTRVEQAPATLRLKVTGGLIASRRDRGNVRIELWKLGEPSAGENKTPAASDRSVPPDGNEHAVELTVSKPGLYKLTVSDGNDRTRVNWDSALPLTIESSDDEPINAKYSEPWSMYFYVPKGTKVLGLLGGGQGELLDSSGRAVLRLKGRDENYYSVAVPNGQDGKLWSIRNARRAIRLLTVPPYFARKPGELLLPSEVVLKDSGKYETGTPKQ